MGKGEKKNIRKISYGVAKEYWNGIEPQLRYKILLDYLSDYLYDSEYKTIPEDFNNLSLINWEGIPLYDCDIPPSYIRGSVCEYLGIGEHYHSKSNDVQWQREYKLRILKLTNENT